MVARGLQLRACQKEAEAGDAAAIREQLHNLELNVARTAEYIENTQAQLSMKKTQLADTQPHK